MKKAGVALIINQDGLILSISRRNNKLLFGLPGGKVEVVDNDTKDAAIRETFEETSVDIKECCLIFERIDGDFVAHCYYASQWQGEPKTNEEGEVKWLTATQLTSTMAAFGAYNIRTLQAFHKLYPDVKIKELSKVLKPFADDQVKLFKPAVEKIVGSLSRWEVRPDSIVLRTSDTANITIKHITAISELFGTDEINFNFGMSGFPGYSDMTPGAPAEAGYIQILRKGITKEAP